MINYVARFIPHLRGAFLVLLPRRNRVVSTNPRGPRKFHSALFRRSRYRETTNNEATQEWAYPDLTSTHRTLLLTCRFALLPHQIVFVELYILTTPDEHIFAQVSHLFVERWPKKVRLSRVIVVCNNILTTAPPPPASLGECHAEYNTPRQVRGPIALRHPTRVSCFRRPFKRSVLPYKIAPPGLWLYQGLH